MLYSVIFAILYFEKSPKRQTRPLATDWTFQIILNSYKASALPRRKIIHVETSTLYQLKSEVAKTSQHVDDLKSKFGTFKAPQVLFRLITKLDF